MTAFHIDHYQFGRITIAGKTYTKDLVLLPDRLITGWWRQEGHLLQVADLAEVLRAGVQLLVIGQGAYGRMQVAAEVQEVLENAGIRWIALPTGDACLEYNRTAHDQQVAAALHLTC